MKDSAIVAPAAKRRRSASTGCVDGKGFVLDPPFGIVIRLHRSGLNPDLTGQTFHTFHTLKILFVLIFEHNIILEFSLFLKYCIFSSL